MYRLFLVFALLQSCKIEKIYFRRNTPKPFSQWDISIDKKRSIIQELYKRSVLKPGEPSAITKGYYYTPQVTNNLNYGLYHLDNFSHRMPINIINSANLITIIGEGMTQQALLDSAKVAMSKHGNQLSDKLKDRIILQLTQESN